VLLGARVVINFLDIAGVAAVGLLGAAGASGFLGQEETAFFGITVDLRTPGLLLTVMIVIAAFFFLKAILSILLARFSAFFVARIEVKNAREIAEFLFSGGLSEIRQYSKSEVQWAVTGSTNTTFSGVLSSVGILVAETSLLIFMFGLFLFVDPLAAIAITLYFAAVIIVFQLLSSKRVKNSGRDTAQGNMDVTKIALDMFEAFKEISVLSKQRFFLDRFTVARKQYALGDARMRFLQGVPRYFVETALAVGALAFVAWQLVRGEVSEGLVAAGVFITGGVRMMAALLPLQGAVMSLRNQTEQAKTAQEILLRARQRVTEEADHTENLTVLDADDSLNPKGVAVELEDVTFRHPGADRPAVKNVSFVIPPGGYVALVGPSGAGKTTLADLILGLNSPDLGRVQVGGRSALETRRRRPGLMAYVPQRPGLVSGSLVDNIALGEDESNVDFARVHDALQKARLEDFVTDLPEGVRTPLGKNLDNLSGGQIQRLGLARALYTQPKLIVLDEATSALDAEAEASISDSIRNIGADTTVIVIAHRLSTVQRADQVHVIEHGNLVASGTFKELRKSVPMIQEYVRLMSFDED
jgi:ATP-binding cassette subfamily C protein